MANKKRFLIGKPAIVIFELLLNHYRVFPPEQD